MVDSLNRPRKYFYYHGLSLQGSDREWSIAVIYGQPSLFRLDRVQKLLCNNLGDGLFPTLKPLFHKLVFQYFLSLLLRQMFKRVLFLGSTSSDIHD